MLLLSACRAVADDQAVVLQDLLTKLENATAEDRVAAAKAIVGISSEAPEAIGALVKSLTDSSPDRRVAAALVLGEIGKPQPEVVAGLLSALEDESLQRDDLPVWIFAASALGKLGPAVTPDLIKRLDHAKKNVRRGAAIALHGIGPGAVAAVPPLIKLLQEDDPATRNAAIYALYGIGKPSAPAMPVLIKMLRSDDFHTQYWSCRAIGKIGAPQALAAVPKMIELLGTGVTSVRRNAADAIGEIGPAVGDRELQPLATALKSPIYPVRRSAAIALGKLGPLAAGSAPELRAAMDERHSIRAEAAGALWQVTGDPHPGMDILLAALQSSGEPWEAALAFQRLGAAAQPALDQLVPLLEANSSETQLFAVYAIASMGPPARKALPALRSMLDTPDDFLRDVVRQAIAVLETE